MERNLEHTASTSWATERMTLEGLLERALYSLRDRSERAAVIDLSDETSAEIASHIVALERGRAYVRTAARSVDTLASAKAWLRQRYPIAQPEEKQEVRISFWAHDRAGDADLTLDRRARLVGDRGQLPRGRSRRLSGRSPGAGSTASRPAA